MITTTTSPVDVAELTRQVRQMYTDVAHDPRRGYHFELGRPLAERLGYDPAMLDGVPVGAIDSFAGVGNPVDADGLRAGERVLDLGSGSGTDAFYASLRVGPTGSVVGRDFTPAQLAKATHLRDRGSFTNVTFSEGAIEELPFEDATFDVVISNGVVNLSADKARVLAETARVLRPGGRLSFADIVSTEELPDEVVCNADLWAACIGGASQQDRYQEMIEAAGLTVESAQRNDYRFISDSATGATDEWGVKSVTYLARRR